MVLGKSLMRGSLDYDLGAEDLRAFEGPVRIVVGSDSHPSLVGIARAMAEAFPDGRLGIWEGRHHLDPAHRADAERFAAKLKAFWRGEPATSHG